MKHNFDPNSARLTENSFEGVRTQLGRFLTSFRDPSEHHKKFPELGMQDLKFHLVARTGTVQWLYNRESSQSGVVKVELCQSKENCIMRQPTC